MREAARRKRKGSKTQRQTHLPLREDPLAMDLQAMMTKIRSSQPVKTKNSNLQPHPKVEGEAGQPDPHKNKDRGG